MGQDEGTVPKSVAECMKLLRRKGFRQSLVRDEVARTDAVMFNRVWRGVRETVLAYSESEALAYRVRTDDADAADPFTVDPDQRMWHHGGEFLDVARQLLALPPPPGHSVFG
ncbi:hypothetical protein [Crossiella cryophila]|uniref:Uncharacterized protein n=1 Tax=Crossiella cryophila TaxID=43355 RepID=A0A7W7CHZ9_9PSEU|nr:hypothetical protein [Crossiella cryophila]MBB4681480.1 hypothetical protein [Crossiella cryophila]